MAQPVEQVKQSFYVGKPDDKYKVLSRPIGMDTSSSALSTRIVEPSNGVTTARVESTVSTVECISGQLLTFDFTVSPTQLIDWDNSHIEITGHFTENDATIVDRDDYVLPWNLMLRVFRECNIDVNGTRVFSKSDDDFFKSATIRNITEKSKEELENSSFVFAPIDDYVYSSGVLTDGSSLSTLGSSASQERNLRWIPVLSAQRVTKMCSFKDMFFSMPGLSKNLRNVKMTMRLNTDDSSSKASVRLGTVVTGLTAQAYFYPRQIKLHLHEYTPSPSSSAIGLTDKMNQEAEHLCFIDPEIRVATTANTMTVTNQENVQYVCVTQFTDNLENYTSSYHYNNCGNTMFLNGYSDTTPANATVLVNTAIYDANLNTPPSTIQIQYAGINYPSIPLSIRNEGYNDLLETSGLYREYSRAVKLMGIKNPAIGENFFRSCFPFALFKMLPNPKFMQSSDIVVRIPDYPSNNTGKNQVDIVYGKLKSFNIAPSGVVSSVEPTF
jgi:hypothetical protein